MIETVYQSKLFINLIYFKKIISLIKLINHYYFEFLVKQNKLVNRNHLFLQVIKISYLIVQQQISIMN